VVFLGPKRAIHQIGPVIKAIIITFKIMFNPYLDF
jgi:hypothetical protein